MGSLTIWHWIVVFIVVALLFGPGRISSLLQDLGAGIGKFKRGLQDETASQESLSPPRARGENVERGDKADP